MKDPALPPRVFAKGKQFYLVTADGKRRVWIKLCSIKEGLPAVYAAIARLMAEALPSDRMPAIIATWERDEMPRHADATQRDDQMYGRAIAEAFAEFTAAQVTPKTVAAYLKQYRDKPRTFNAHRGMIREYLRFSIEQGYRDAGTNPCDAIKTMRVPARARYITDSELRRIKAACCRGKDGKRTRSGLMICALIDMAYLTGQRIGDLLTIEWRNVTDAGIRFKPAKTEGTTGAAIVIEWTPRLRALEARLRSLRKERETLVPEVFTKLDGQPYTYSGAHTAWVRAVERAGIREVHFHDLRAKALTDVDESRGTDAAQRMGTHSTQAQTADYIRHKSARKTGATR